MNSIYFTDEYPREGCSIKIRIPEKQDEPGRNWAVEIYPPESEKHDIFLEAYLATSLAGAINVAKCLIKGEKVPKNYHLDGSMVIGRQNGT